MKNRKSRRNLRPADGKSGPHKKPGAAENSLADKVRVAADLQKEWSSYWLKAAEKIQGPGDARSFISDVHALAASMTTKMRSRFGIDPGSLELIRPFNLSPEEYSLFLQERALLGLVWSALRLKSQVREDAVIQARGVHPDMWEALFVLLMLDDDVVLLQMPRLILDGQIPEQLDDFTPYVDKAREVASYYLGAGVALRTSLQPSSLRRALEEQHSNALEGRYSEAATAAVLALGEAPPGLPLVALKPRGDSILQRALAKLNALRSVEPKVSSRDVDDLEAPNADAFVAEEEEREELAKLRECTARAGLTERQLEILKLTEAGLTQRDIASKLGMKSGSVADILDQARGKVHRAMRGAQGLG